MTIQPSLKFNNQLGIPPKQGPECEINKRMSPTARSSHCHLRHALFKWVCFVKSLLDSPLRLVADIDIHCSYREMN